MNWTVPQCRLYRRRVLTAVFAGLGLGLSLIIAIGAQNLFVLRQGLRREHVVAVAAICAAADAALIALGVSGVGFALQAMPGLVGGGPMGWRALPAGICGAGSPSSVATQRSCPRGERF